MRRVEVQLSSYLDRAAGVCLDQTGIKEQERKWRMT